MRIQPKTEAEISADGLFPAGVYTFEVMKAEETTSKAGNDMIALTLKVYNEDDGFTLVNDYLLESIAYKLRHFCETIGLLPQYESGTLDANEMIKQAGKVKIAIEHKNPDYPAKNVVKDYVVGMMTAPRAKAPERAREPAMASDPFGDIPF